MLSLRTPSWCMPASCAKAFAPDYGLVRLHVNPPLPGRRACSSDISASCLSRKCRASCRFSRLGPITISSSDAFPALSPRPLTVHSTCLAPSPMAAWEFATARPRSLWQWTPKDHVVKVRDVFYERMDYVGELLRDRVPDRVGDVDGGLPRSGRPRRPRCRDSRCPFASRPRRRTRRSRCSFLACLTAPLIISSTWSLVFLSLCLRCISEVAMKVWILGLFRMLLRPPSRGLCP